MSSVTAQTKASSSIRRSARRKSAHPEIAHFVFERRGRRIDVLDLALLVHHRHGLCAEPFAARRMHGSQRNRRIDLLKHSAHHVTSHIDFSDDSVGF